MALTLRIINVESLDNAGPTRLVLDRRGAKIGRSPNGDWCLPDERNFISSQHCEVAYRDGAYLLIDRSKNGSYLNGSTTRMVETHRIEEGDEIAIGHYKLRASFREGGAPTPPPVPLAWPEQAAPTSRARQDWGPSPAPARASMGDAWDAPLRDNPVSARRGWDNDVDPRAESYSPAISPPLREPGGPMRREAPGSEGAPPPAAWPGEQQGSGPRAGSGGGDIWDRFSSSNEIDWERGFGPRPEPAPMRRPEPRAAEAGPWEAMLEAAGLSPKVLRGDPFLAGAAAGALLKRLVAGLVVMLEARKRAKDEMGAQATMFTFGHNPLKFGGRPEQALAQLLNPPDPGFMGAEAAVEDSFQDLQAHQVATVAAMQGALRQTLERFSPHAIRERAEGRGLISRIIPMAKEAELWRAYEREFDGVVLGSDEAFLDVFAHAFRQAYDEAASKLKARR